MSSDLTQKSLSFNSARFLISASRLEECPPDHGSEVAFAGRSNAGKSSAINAICDQNKLAKTSKTPGRTQLINFFSLSDEFRLVDLPGYGYVKTYSNHFRPSARSYYAPRAPSLAAGDLNDDGVLDISDPTYLLAHLFWGGAAPPEPFAQVGLDPTPDDPYLCGDRICGRPESGQVISVNSGSAAGLQMAIDIAEPGAERNVIAKPSASAVLSAASAWPSVWTRMTCLSTALMLIFQRLDTGQNFSLQPL